VRPQHLVLVPGFFGFSRLGELVYFGHVEHALRTRMERRGWHGRIVTVGQHPTASLLRRSARLGEVLDRLLASEDGDVHLIGHSTGGLDARLLLTDPARTDRLERVRTLVALSSPHYGSPLAAHWTGSSGKLFIKLLSLVTLASMERQGIEGHFLQTTLRFFGEAEHLVAPGGLLDGVFRQLLDRLTPASRAAMEAFFEDVEQDRALIDQLVPGATQIFAALVRDPPSVRLGSVASWTPPRARHQVSWDALVPWHAASRWLFEELRAKTSGPGAPPGVLTPADEAQLTRALGVLPAPGDNDGFVPTLSQVKGTLIHATVADHVDTIGHYHDPQATPPHFDWFDSGSGFGRAQFEALWDDVFAFVSG
jgi:hypothetical protein